MGASWTRFLQIAQNGVSNSCHQRVLLCATLLGTMDMKDLAAPVYILQTEPYHLAAPQSVTTSSMIIARLRRSIVLSPTKLATNLCTSSQLGPSANPSSLYITGASMPDATLVAQPCPSAYRKKLRSVLASACNEALLQPRLP